MNETERVKAQTREEWSEENFPDRRVTPRGSVVTSLPKVIAPELAYVSHRTIKNVITGKGDGHVVLVFANVKTGEETIAFFNVELRRQRGKARGECYPVGSGGQFLPLPRSNFRKFWIACIGTPPRRWAAVHKEMKSKLGQLRFTGELTSALNSNGQRFSKMNNPKLMEQIGNKKGTILEQRGNSDWEQRIAANY